MSESESESESGVAVAPPISTEEALGKESKPRIRKQQRNLRYNFPQDEINELSQQLAERVGEHDKVEADKKSAASQFKSQIDQICAEMRTLGAKVTNKYEFRDIECEIHYHEPKQGMKRLIRMDTLEVIENGAMTDAECQDIFPFDDSGPAKEEGQPDE